jgi:hypothetical protein
MKSSVGRVESNTAPAKGAHGKRLKMNGGINGYVNENVIAAH